MDNEKDDLAQRVRNAERFADEFLEEETKPQPYPTDYVAMAHGCIHNCNACPNCDNN